MAKSAYDLLTGRSAAAVPPPPPEPTPLTALERFRLRQTERAKQREMGAGPVQGAKDAAHGTAWETAEGVAYRYRSSPAKTKAGDHAGDDAAPVNPLLMVESY
jgi:hypothetical protein